jgi:hypothetical protein
MQALLAPLYELAEYSQMKTELRKGGGIVSVSGVGQLTHPARHQPLLLLNLRSASGALRRS